MMDNGRKVKKMEREFRYGKMGKFMKDFGLKIRLMDLEG